MYLVIMVIATLLLIDTILLITVAFVVGIIVNPVLPYLIFF